jgi:hypothetical protein
VRVIDKVWESVLRSRRRACTSAPVLRFRLPARRAPPRHGAHTLADRAPPELDDMTFADWLRAGGQTENAIRGFWNLIVLPTLNGDITTVSADLALMVFQEGFLRDRNGANVGWARVGLFGAAGRRRANTSSPEAARCCSTADIRVGVDDGRAVAALRRPADYLVLAADPRSLPPSLSRARESRSSRESTLATSPIVNVHFWYDRQVTDMGSRRS